MFRKRPDILAILVLFLPLALALIWSLLDQGLPRQDEADYFYDAYYSYQVYESEGFWKSISHSYFNRSSKGVILPAVLNLFLIATNGDFQLSSKIFGLFFYSIFVISVYFFISTLLHKVFSSLVTVAVVTLPWVFYLSHSASTEVAFVSLSSLAILLLQRYGVNRKWTWFEAALASVTIGLIPCFRPAEFSVFILPLLVGFLIIYLNRQIISKKDLYTIGAIFFVSTVVAFSLRLGPWVPWPALVILLVVWTVFKKKQMLLADRLVLVTILSSMFTLIWYAPHIELVMDWLQGASMGHWIPEGTVKEHWRFSFSMDLWTKLHFDYVVLGLGLLASGYQKSFSTDRYRYLFYAFLYSLFALIIVAETARNTDQRYYIWAGLVIHGFVLVSLLYPNSRFNKLRYTLFAIVMALNIAVSTLTFARDDELIQKFKLAKVARWPDSAEILKVFPYYGEDAVVKLVNQLKAVLSKEDSAYLTVFMLSSESNNSVLHPSTVSSLLVQEGFVNSKVFYATDISGVDCPLLGIADSAKKLMIIPRRDRPPKVHTDLNDPKNQFYNDLIRIIDQNQTQRYHLQIKAVVETVDPYYIPTSLYVIEYSCRFAEAYRRLK